MLLSPEPQRFLAYWANWRRRGQGQYLLFESLVFGAAAAAVGTFLVALTLSGLLHGLYSWRANQRRYRELTGQ